MNDQEEKKTQNDEEMQEEGEVLQKTYEFTPTGDCTYKQRGPYLVCISCEVQHANWIGMDKIMTGEDEEGKPIIKSRSKLNVAH